MDYNNEREMLREMQNKLLAITGRMRHSFALAGGTALELFYLQHRFSRDLDFFSPVFSGSEIDALLAAFQTETKTTITPAGEMLVGGRAQVRRYVMPLGEAAQNLSLKLDFVEDVVAPERVPQYFDGVPVYPVDCLYRHKLVAMAGPAVGGDASGRDVLLGRQAARDVVDVYYLSQRIRPLHEELAAQSPELRRGMARWYQVFPRQDFIVDFLDLAVYDRALTGRAIIGYLEAEIRRMIGDELS